MSDIVAAPLSSPVVDLPETHAVNTQPSLSDTLEEHDAHAVLSVLEQQLDALLASHTTLKQENSILQEKLHALQQAHRTLLQTHEAVISKVEHMSHTVREQIKQL